MSLVRTGIVIATGIVLMPSDRASQEHMLLQATEAAGWAMSYCEREPGNCEQAGRLLEGLKEKAIVAGQLALEATQKYAATSVYSAAAEQAQPLQGMLSRSAAVATAAVVWPADTLTAADLRPAWRGSKTSR